MTVAVQGVTFGTRSGYIPWPLRLGWGLRASSGAWSHQGETLQSSLFSSGVAAVNATDEGAPHLRSPCAFHQQSLPRWTRSPHSVCRPSDWGLFVTTHSEPGRTCPRLRGFPQAPWFSSGAGSARKLVLLFVSFALSCFPGRRQTQMCAPPPVGSEEAEPQRR